MIICSSNTDFFKANELISFIVDDMHKRAYIKNVGGGARAFYKFFKKIFSA